MSDIERLILSHEDSPRPSAAFEERLFAALERKQRELGRVPAAPVPASRIPVYTIAGLAAACVAAAFLAERSVAPTSPAPASPAPQIATSATPPAPTPPAPPAPTAPTVRPDLAPTTTRVDASERLRILLPDGSVLFLDEGASAVLEKRSVHVERGRGFVEVAKGAQDFTVVTEKAKAIAHGTKFAFDVSHGLEVAVSQGTVELENADGRCFVERGELGQAPLAGLPTAQAAKRISWLCEWMRDLYCPCKRTRSSAGELVAIDPYGQEILLTVRNVLVDTYIEDGIARTTIDTTYFNENWQRLEGTFYFLVPPGASVSRLAMYVNGELMEGGVLEREEARAVYEQIRYQRTRDPALLEWMEGNVYKMRIFPLEPRQEKRVIVSFTQELEPLYGKLRYALPLEAQGRDIYGHLGIRVRLKNAAALPETSYPLEASREGDDIVLVHDEGPTRPKKDLILYLDGAQVPQAAAATTEDGRYVLARWRPAVAAQPKKHEPRHFAIVVDESAARTQAEIITQNELVSRLLSELDDQDEFQLLTVSTRCERIVKEWIPCRRGASLALEKLDGWQPLGAQNLGLALAKAAEILKDEKDPHVIYVGSGIASFGEQDPGRLVDSLPQGTVFVGVGVGKKTDESLLASLSSRTGGTYVLVNPEEPVAWRVFDLVTALATPRITGLSAIALDAHGSAVKGEVFLSRGTISDGEEVRVIGRFPQTAAPAKFAIAGFQGDEPIAATLPVERAREDALYLPRLWARRYVESLIRDGADHHREAIVALGKRYFLATPFTSLIVLENAAMYVQYKVEPAPADPFAFYSTPKRIPIVSDWNGGPTAFTDEDELLKTVILAAYPAFPAPEFGLPHTITTHLTPPLEAPAAAPPVPPTGDARFDEFEFEKTLGAIDKPAEVTELAGIAAGTLAELHKERAQLAAETTAELPKLVAAAKNDWLHPGARVGSTFLRGDVDVGYNFTDRSPGSFGLLVRDRIGGHEAQWRARGYDMKKSVRPSYSYGGPSPQERDLTLLAPGLHACEADVRTLLEAELGRKPLAGKQDPKALEALAKARKRFGARAVHFQGWEGYASGDGRLCLRHRRDSGLEEVIVATSADIFEIYSDLGLAAHRTRSRHQDARLAELFTFLPPTERALEGWDVSLKDENTVVLATGTTRIELVLEADGSVKTNDRSLTLSEPTDAASFEPELSGMVVLDMPVRTPAYLAKKIDAAKDDEKPFLEDQMFFSRCVMQEHPVRNDKRLGILVLRLACWSLMPVEAQNAEKTHPAFAGYARAVLEEKDEDRAEGAREAVAKNPQGFYANMGRFLAALATMRDSLHHSSSRETSFALAYAYANQTCCPELIFVLAQASRIFSAGDVAKITALFARVPDSSDEAFPARLTAAQELWRARRLEEAARYYEDAYACAMAQGFFPVFDAAVPTVLGGARFKAFEERVLAWNADKPLARIEFAASACDTESLIAALSSLPKSLPAGAYDLIALQLIPRIAAMADTKQADRALDCLRDRPDLQGLVSLKDAEATLAQRRGRISAAAKALEAALSLEASQRIVNLASFQQRGAVLLALYQQMASVLDTGEPRSALVERILKTVQVLHRAKADRIDLYEAATRALMTCEADAQALEVATTPIALHPADGAGWMEAGQTFSANGEHSLAQGLYQRAARVEPQDPTPLFCEAVEWEALGRNDKARALYEEISKKTWHERFNWLVQQATEKAR